MNLLDSSGWLEFFLDGDNAGVFEKLLDEPESLIVPSIIIFEVMRVVRRVASEKVAAEAFGTMTLHDVIPLDAHLASYASQLAQQNKLAMADAIIFATARSFEAELWTQDIDLKGLPGVKYIHKKPK